jgi:hypothetical protein
MWMRLSVPHAAHRRGKREKSWRFPSCHSGGLRYRRYSGCARPRRAIFAQSPESPYDVEQ